MRKSAPFATARSDDRYSAQNGFKQIEIAYLALISHLDELIHPIYTLSTEIKPLAQPNTC